jgi:ABC-2 type transport system ATP-binding protein
MIRLEALTKSFAGTVALDRLTFEVARGEVVGLLGPNGAGKTTCLRVLTCFVPPSSGGAWVDGLDVRRHGREVRQRVGYLPEGAPLYPELRVVEHLRFRAGLRGLRRRDGRRAIEEVVESCGLAEVTRRIVGQLSRGFRQRLGLASALLGDPPILVLDEPTVGLDPNQIREVRGLIRSLGGEHTVLLSTHLLSEVETTCTRAVIINGGRVVAQGPVAQLRSASSTVVTVRGPREQVVDLLGNLLGRDRVELVATDNLVHRVRLHGVDAPAERERVAAALVAAGIALQELAAEQRSLEQVFAQLTEGKEP